MLKFVKITGLFLMVLFLQMNVFSNDLMHLPKPGSYMWCIDEHHTSSPG